MSIKFTAAIWEDKRITNPIEKLVALALADYANHDTGRCFPSYATIACRTLLSTRQVMRCIKSLEQKGVIKVEHRCITNSGMAGKVFSSNNYTLTPSRGGSDCQSLVVQTRSQNAPFKGGGSDCQSLGVVSISHQGSDCQSPDPVIEPINLTGSTNRTGSINKNGKIPRVVPKAAEGIHRIKDNPAQRKLAREILERASAERDATNREVGP
jgi:Helix-turn-helix domain